VAENEKRDRTLESAVSIFLDFCFRCFLVSWSLISSRSYLSSSLITSLVLSRMVYAHRNVN
jgi:hypothetical protein